MDTTDARKTQALFMILAGHTYVAIAKAVGVCSRTVRRWAEEPEFARAVKKESEGVANITRAHLLVLMGRMVEKGLAATDFLDQIQKTDEAPIALRMRAAGQLINNSYKVAALSIKREDAKDAKREKQAEAENDLREAVVEVESESGHEGGQAAPAASEEKSANSESKQNLPQPSVEQTSLANSNVTQKADKSGQKRTSERPKRKAERRSRTPRPHGTPRSHGKGARGKREGRQRKQATQAA